MPTMDAAARRVQPGCAADPVRKVLHLPRPRRRGKKGPVPAGYEEAAKAALGGGESSKLIHRITAQNPAMRMPPQYSGLKLNDREIATLRDWVLEGAPLGKALGFPPPRRPPLPEVRNRDWPRNPIDSFILARLEREGLKPSPEADKRDAAAARDARSDRPAAHSRRRSTRSCGDASPNAYEKVVDRLLASPRYGERMAEPGWTPPATPTPTAIRTIGERTMWRWRDWVIDAFNRNQPFDQFTIEQTRRRHAARMPRWSRRSPPASTAITAATPKAASSPRSTRVEYVVDRVETTATVWLGLTLGCARCHDHKYDPFTQKEYYRLYAYFNNVPELGRVMKEHNSPPLVAAPDREQQAALHQLEERIQAEQSFLEAKNRVIEKAQRAWEMGAGASERDRLETGERPGQFLPGSGRRGCQIHGRRSFLR